MSTNISDDAAALVLARINATTDQLAVQIQDTLAHMHAALASEVHRQMAEVNTQINASLGSELQRQLTLLDGHIAAQLERITTFNTQALKISPFVAQERILELAQLLMPACVKDSTKVRLGAEHDGGYVMLRIDEPGVALSLGIADEVTWDLQMAEQGFIVHQFDHTVSAPPLSHQNFRFDQSKILGTPGGEGITLAEILQRLPADIKPVLKIDIEGDEWDVFSAIEPQDLVRFSQIVCEFHNFHHIENDAWFERARHALKKLAASHAVVHVHANNYGQLLSLGNVAFPEILEVSFVSREGRSFAKSDELFPTPIDRPNRADRPDIILGSFSFGPSAPF